MARSIHSFKIPSMTLPIGQTVFGPFAVDSNITAEIDIDRTVVLGLNSLTSATALEVALEQSPDGVTWNGLVDGGQWAGGIIIIKGVQLNTNILGVSGMASDTTQVRATFTVTGPTDVAIAGNVTIN